MYYELNRILACRRSGPLRCTPIGGIESNGHFGLEHDRTSNTWTPNMCENTGPEDAMRENPMGKLFKEFLVLSNFTMFNSCCAPHHGGKGWSYQGLPITGSILRMDPVVLSSGPLAYWGKN